MNARRTLGIQLLLLAGCAALVAQWAWAFPFPGPVVRPLLPPRARWPEAQIRGWAKTSEFPGDYWAFFNRDPERMVPTQPGLVAPADGLFRFHDRRDGRQYLVIALSFWDVHVQRFPCDGVVRAVLDDGDTFMDGEGEGLVYLEEKLCPVQKVVVLDTALGEVRVRLLTSISARRLQVFVKPGDAVRRGQRLGKILAGSTVVLEMAGSIPVSAKVGERVIAGETILGGAR